MPRLRSAAVCDLHAIGCGERVERLAVLKLVEQIGGFGLQALGDLVVAPTLLDLALDLVEGAIARRRDGLDLVPDIAAVGRSIG